MNTQSKISKVLVITAFAAILMIPAKTAFAGYSWSFGYSTGDKHHHRKPYYKKHKKHKKHYKHYGHGHYKPYKRHRRHQRKFHNRYDHFGRHHGHRHFGHAHGPIIRLPRYARTVWHNNLRYYHHNDVYYRHSDCGYYRVSAPVIHEYKTVYKSRPVVKEVYKSEPRTKEIYVDDSTESGVDEFVINIKDSRGEYVGVKIKKYHHGYLGPQGEYYDEFPEVAQLKAMYVK